MDKQEPRIIVPPMSAQRDEPELQSLPLHSHQERQATTSLVQTTADNSNTTGLIIFALLVLMGAGAAVYWIQTLQKQIESLQTTNTSQEENINELRQRLSSTGENATTSLDALSVKNDEQDFEIRKLWDVSNKRNKKQIEANRTTGKTLSTRLKTLQQSSSKQEKQLSQLVTSQSTIQDSIKASRASQTSSNEQFSQRLDDQNRSFVTVELSASQNRDELQQLDEQIMMLKKQVTKMQQRDPSDAMLSIQLTLDDIQARLSAVEARQP